PIPVVTILPVQSCSAWIACSKAPSTATAEIAAASAAKIVLILCLMSTVLTPAALRLAQSSAIGPGFLRLCRNGEAEIVEGLAHVPGQPGRDLERAAARMRHTQPPRVQMELGRQLGAGNEGLRAAVLAVAQDRRAEHGRVDTQLV